ncbi:MAG TPA: UPF0149 family protein [Gammaproteobacteria bacterium]|nr:UPF0149 family protein [Gammaproteobacteria bacterium]
MPDFANYNDIADILLAAKSPLQPAEMHGLLCGHIAGTAGQMDAALQKLILGKNKNQEYRTALQQLYEMSYHQMSEFSFEFTLLLPDDDSDINTRTEALGLWCQGFLTGLKQTNVPVEQREESDVTETINDFIEIGQVNYGDMADNEEDETAYFELVEYVRLGALLIFNELNTSDPQKSVDEKNQLH